MKEYTSYKSSLVALVALAPLFGCGSGTDYAFTNLQGTVTVAGVPLESGSIRFLPQENVQGPAVGAEIRDGAYHVQQVPVGEVRALISAIRKTKPLPDDGSGLVKWETENLIPQEHRQGSLIIVEPGQSRQDFHL